MKRSTVYNDDLTIRWDEVNNKNKKLLKEFINYCVANDKSPQTCKQYEAQLKVFFCWNLNENDNKFFIDVKKRDFVNFFGWGRAEMGWSPNRLSSLRAVLSSFSNFIERILDEDYPMFRNVIKVLEPIRVEPVREKTIIEKDDIINSIEKLVSENQIQEACFLSLLFSSGMRKSEAVQMKVEYFTTNKKDVFNGLAYATPKIRTKGHGAKGKQIPRSIFKASFDKYLNLWLDKRKELNIENEYLFVVKNNGEYVAASISTFNSWIKRIGDEMGVDLYDNSLRHAFTTYLKKQGYPVDIIQKIQNWASADLVGVYVDSTNEEELDGFFKQLNPDGTYSQ